MEKAENLRISSSLVHRNIDLEKKENQIERLTDAEILKKSWSRRALIVAFVSLFATTFVFSFVKYSTKVYDAYATSAFSRHSALSTANAVYTITGMVTYPLIANLSNIFGRAEGFLFAVSFMVLSQILYAGCQNTATYIASGIFESIGDTGYTIMQQIFIADTTNLINRGLWASLPEAVASIPTLYLGTIVADKVLEDSTWRWGYGMWAIMIPFCAAPLILTMLVLQRRGARNGYVRKSIWNTGDVNAPFPKRLSRLFWNDLDLLGAFLLVAGLGLSLIPLSLTGARNSDRWKEGSFIAMLVVGVAVLACFFIWDARFAKSPFVPFRMIKERTVVAACLLSILDFFHYACFTIFFPSYLQVAADLSAGHASRIDNALRVTFQVASVLVGICMKYVKKSQIFVLIGVPLCVLGQGLQIYLTDINGSQTGNEASFVTAKVLVGLGRGMYQTAAQVSIQALVPYEDVAVVTGVYYASMNLGGAIGTSVSGAIWNNLLLDKLTEYLPDNVKSQANAIYGSIVVAKKFVIGTDERAAINLAYRETQQTLAIASTLGLVPMLGIMFLLKNVDLSQGERDEATRDEIATEREKESAQRESKVPTLKSG